jgi:hypothetical protein
VYHVPKICAPQDDPARGAKIAKTTTPRRGLGTALFIKFPGFPAKIMHWPYPNEKK